MLYICALFISFFIFSPLSGEIKEISLFWNPVICNQKCGNILGQKLQQMPGVEEMNLNAGAGTATLKWKEKLPFSYHSLKFTLQSVGVGQSNVRVKARGTVTIQGNKVSFFSKDDNTRFVLISPLAPQPGQYTPRPNAALMTLNEGVKNQLIEPAKQGKIMVVEGPLYQPWNSPPLWLMLEKVQIEK